MTCLRLEINHIQSVTTTKRSDQLLTKEYIYIHEAWTPQAVQKLYESRNFATDRIF